MGIPEVPRSVQADTVVQLLDEMGVEPTSDNVEQLTVFLQALMVYHGRTGAYGQVWKQYGALSNLLSVARKADRLMSVWWHSQHRPTDRVPLLHKDHLDDAIDLLNYCVFFVRNARALNITGEAPDRPEDLG